ncbi:MAG: beta-lactamase family protein [Deltaproteobacteria bacterium]|nr:beta-lactamase family protein [Deltaproteobacteria bacterium]MBW2394362.1 beta-lactamase family protein [Deltaproteobacteria bacterium]
MGDIQGSCHEAFEGVRAVFEEGFRERDEIGAAVSVFLDGEPVVDLWGGFADQARTQPWQRDTLVNVYSTTKGAAAFCAHRLVDQGKLDLDAPVAEYWPEFAAEGKQDIPVRWLLSHRAGLPAVREVLPGEALYDWDAMASALAAETPWWTPGEEHGYHALTYGWLVGEVVRRISGKSLGTFFRDEIAGPLDLDFHIGLPEAEHGRVAEMGPMAMPGPDEKDALDIGKMIMADPEGMTARAFGNPPSMMAGVNVPEWRSAEIPGANGHTNARAVAKLYGIVALNDGRVISSESIEAARCEQSRGPDAVLGLSTRFGLGFMLSQDERTTRFGPSEEAFGHPGAGGSVGLADTQRRLGFGYVMNRMGPRILLDDRALALIDAAYAAL